MIKPHWRLVVGLALLASAATEAADGDTNAAEMKFRVYKFAVSTSAACTDPITVFSSSDGVLEDMLAGPTFGSGAVPEGTYPCVMIELSKVIQTKGTTACTTAWDDLICNEGDGQQSQTIDGTSVTCSGGNANDQHVTLYITTISDGTSGMRALLPPLSDTDTTSGLKLTSPFVVSGNTTGTFKVKSTNFIVSSQCGTKAPTFSFE